MFRLDLTTKVEWEEIPEAGDWPSPRLGFNLYTADNALWIFGGTCTTDDEPDCDDG